MKTPNWIKQLKDPKVSLKNYLPIYAPILVGNEKKYLSSCIDEGWLSPKGDFVRKFEQEFAKYCGCPYAVSCASGTSAIHLALMSVGIKKGDEVIVPSLTMISTAFAVSYTGAKPVFADCEIATGNIDTDSIIKNITPKTKAVIPVDTYGTPPDLIKIHKIAKKYNLLVIEDAAEGIGSLYRGQKIGNVSALTAFSLYINKIITTGQGGMITTRSKKLYKKLQKLNNYYFSPLRHFWHQKIGYNFRLSNLQAAVGLAQIEYIDEILKRKAQIADLYSELLTPSKEYLIPLSVPNGTKTNYWHIAYRLTCGKYNIMKLRTLLGKNGIETRSFFIPLHLQPPYRKKEYAGKFPNAELLAKTGILLPSGSVLLKSDIERICLLIRQYFIKGR